MRNVSHKGQTRLFFVCWDTLDKKVRSHYSLCSKRFEVLLTCSQNECEVFSCAHPLKCIKFGLRNVIFADLGAFGC